MAADLSITTTAVTVPSGTPLGDGIAGATITIGQLLYQDASDSGKLKLANADTTALTADVVGIALSAAASGQRVIYLPVAGRGTRVTMNAVLTAGQAYYASGNDGAHTGGAAGGICTFADLVTSEFPTLIGVAESTTKLIWNVQATGVAKA